ncbi:MAG: hypothetical protein WCR31_01370 [Treponema sp.]
MKKKVYVCCSLVLVSAVFLFAQNKGITLPDVTTVVSGDALTAGRNAVPDFSEVLPSESDSKTVLPELPEVPAGKNAGADAAVSKAKTENSVYAEGLVGGGGPGIFNGNFSVYRSAGADPFRIGFNYASADGYARNSFTDGFYDRTAAITGEKTFTTKNATYELSGSYESLGNGLQNQGEEFYDVTKQTVAGKADAAWILPGGFSLHSDVNTGWYNRFAGITGSQAAADYAEKSAVFSLSPSVMLGWDTGGFSSYFSAAWCLQSDTAAVLSDGNTNRTRFGTGLGWKNDFINIFGDAAAVIGTKLGGNPVVVPFTLGISSSFVTGLSSRKTALSAEGGIVSEQPFYAELEKKYTFSELSFIPGETSDWYGKITVAVPVKDIFSFTTEAEYRKTAFGNGVWEPDYEDGFAYGQYTYKQTDRSLLCTDTGISFSKGILTLRGSWKAQWLYVPVLETPDTITVSASLQGNDSRWGAGTEISLSPDEHSDHMPELSFSGFYRLTKAVRLAVTADDVVKLITGKSRTYAGRYITRSGSAGFVIKFFF